MWKSKRCYRCGVSTFIAQDEYGWYRECLQYGHRAELSNLADPRRQPLAVPEEPVLAGTK